MEVAKLFVAYFIEKDVEMMQIDSMGLSGCRV